jgi:hypothetical protein
MQRLVFASLSLQRGVGLVQTKGLGWLWLVSCLWACKKQTSRKKGRKERKERRRRRKEELMEKRT